MKKFSKKASKVESEVEYGDGVLIIDGDELAFVVAASCETRSILVTNNSNSATSTFKHRKDLSKFLEGLCYTDDFFSINDVQEAEPVNYAINTLKRRINNLCFQCKCKNYEIYLSGDNNFRDHLDLPVKYKGDRESNIRPILLNELRDYLITHQGAIVVKNKEADDMLTTRMYSGFESNERVIACTRDKDACGTAGWLFNPDKDNEPKFINQSLGSIYIDTSGANDKVRGYGRKFLYFQILFGDPVDCYCPRDIYKQLKKKKPRFGEKSAFKILNECKTDLECLQTIYNKYKEWYGDGIINYHNWEGVECSKSVIDLIQMYTDCAFMQRRDGDRIDIKVLFENLGIIL